MTTYTILNAVIHNLVKSKGSREATSALRSAALEVKPALKRLIEAVHESYANRAGKSYGSFHPDATLHPAQTHVRRLLEPDGNMSECFIETTRSLMAILADRASNQSFSLGGYVLFADLTNGATRWFLMAVLTDVTGAAINDALDVVDATHLDLSAMRFAGRVNLTELKAGTDRCIGFLRGKKTDVADYFERFMGVETVVKELQETQRLVHVVKQFAADNGLSESDREKLLHDVYQYSDECGRNQMPLDLDTLANRVWSAEPSLLQGAFGRADPPISDGFVPDRRALQGLRKFKAKTSTWALEFDRSAMADHTIRFDPETRVLRITQVPDDVAQRLTNEFSNDEAT